MKNVLIICLALFTFGMQAQRGNNEGNSQRNNNHKDYTAEQIAELRTKKMTLKLDLSEKQQEKVYNLNLQNAKRIKANKGKGKRDKSFEEKSAFLDDKIAEKKELKAVLTKEQFEKWEKTMQHKKRKHMKGKKGQ